MYPPLWLCVEHQRPVSTACSFKCKCQDETTTSGAVKVQTVKVKSWSPLAASRRAFQTNGLSVSLSVSLPPSLFLCARSALCIPAPRRSIRCLSVKVVSNSYHHKRWEQTEKTTTTDIPEIFLPSALHLHGKMLLHALGLVRKSTQVLCHRGLNRP